MRGDRNTSLASNSYQIHTAKLTSTFKKATPRK